MFYQIGAVSCYFLYSLYKSIDFDIFLEELNKIFFLFLEENCIKLSNCCTQYLHFVLCWHLDMRVEYNIHVYLKMFLFSVLRFDVVSSRSVQSRRQEHSDLFHLSALVKTIRVKCHYCQRCACVVCVCVCVSMYVCVCVFILEGILTNLAAFMLVTP